MALAAAAARQRGPARQVGRRRPRRRRRLRCRGHEMRTSTGPALPCCSHAAEQIPEPYFHKIVDHTLDDLLERLEVCSCGVLLPGCIVDAANQAYQGVGSGRWTVMEPSTQSLVC